ncbi:MAG: HAD-IIB family hydrolase [Thaumarchaeota archaeon]|nr:HAD-IIB family hydrolase [Nitrososphaerota archaeon]MCL5317546.1 HAD-IIB family hydrolase [Nitrososphaerota archaeon]
MKIGALFSDYDGTLSPMHVPREKAFIPPKMMRILTFVSQKIPVAIITTKDLKFIKKRVPFARAISAIGGLEIQLSEGIIVVDDRIKERTRVIEKAYEAALSKMMPVSMRSETEVFFERKTTSGGLLAAFCIDWRMAHNKSSAVSKIETITKQCSEAGLYVVESKYDPFVDIYAVEINKGESFAKLKKELKIGDDELVMYLGDSEMDNSAFEAADISIAVKHEESSPHLQSNYFLQFKDLPKFISDLMAAGFDFEPNMVVDNL